MFCYLTFSKNPKALYSWLENHDSTLVDGDITKVISNITNIDLTNYQSERGINMCEVIKGLQTNITDLQTNITDLQTNISDLQTEIDTQKKEIEDLNKENALLRAKLEAFQKSSTNKNKQSNQSIDCETTLINWDDIGGSSTDI